MVMVLICSSLAVTACGQKRKLVKKAKTTTVTIAPKLKEVPMESTFKIKILRISCASLVAQIMDEPYQKLGEEWVPYNVRMKSPYKYVVNIANKCAIPDNVKEGDMIKISLTTENEAEKTPCLTCKMMDYPPAAKINVKFLENLGEEK
jgi:hypothetical protein